MKNSITRVKNYPKMGRTISVQLYMSHGSTVEHESLWNISPIEIVQSYNFFILFFWVIDPQIFSVTCRGSTIEPLIIRRRSLIFLVYSWYGTKIVS